MQTIKEMKEQVKYYEKIKKQQVKLNKLLSKSIYKVYKKKDILGSSVYGSWSQSQPNEITFEVTITFNEKDNNNGKKKKI